jgi:hypothetical protein
MLARLDVDTGDAASNGLFEGAIGERREVDG